MFYFTFLSFIIEILDLQFLSFLMGGFPRLLQWYIHIVQILFRLLSSQAPGAAGSGRAGRCGSGSALFCSFWLTCLFVRGMLLFQTPGGFSFSFFIIGSQIHESAGGAYYLTLYLFSSGRTSQQPTAVCSLALGACM